MQDLYLGMFFPPILKATQRRHVTGVPQHVTDVQMTGGTLLGVPSGSRVKLLCPAGASLLEALHAPKGFTDAPQAHTVSSRTLFSILFSMGFVSKTNPILTEPL